MDRAGVKRLISISTLGIYDEVPGKYGKWNHQMLDGGYLETYAAAAKVIEGSDLDYTIIRPAWLSNKNVVSYETTEKGEAFKGTEVSRKSIADLVVKLINDPSQHIKASLGVDQPGTDAISLHFTNRQKRPQVEAVFFSHHAKRPDHLAARCAPFGDTWMAPCRSKF